MIRQDDDRLPSGTTHLRDPEAAVVAHLQALSTQLDDEPDAEYRARARARLVAMAAVRTPAPAQRSLAARLLDARAGDRPPARWRARMTAGLAGAAVCVTGLAALVAVAAGAQPGDPLYGFKRGTEQTQLALAGDSRGQTLLELASTRLEELRTVSDDADLVRETLHTMDAQTTEGAALLTAQAVADRDADGLGDLAAWSEHQADELESLRADLAPGAEPDRVRSAGLLDALLTRTTGLALALDCPSGPATVGADALGPVPGLCVTEEPPAVPGAPPPPGQDPGTPEPALPPEAASAPTAPATSGTVPPGGTTPAVPGTGGAPVPVPGPVRVPVPGPGPAPAPAPGSESPSGGPLLPTGPLPPLPGTTASPPTATTAPPPVAVPAPGPISICLPPLATVGNC